MTPDRKPTIRAIDVQDDGDRDDLEHAMNAHQTGDDLPSPAPTLGSGFLVSCEPRKGDKCERRNTAFEARAN